MIELKYILNSATSFYYVFIIIFKGMHVTKRQRELSTKPRLVISKADINDQWSIAVDMKTKGTETVFSEDVEVDTCKT